ncbi:hypothetical protein C2G38_2168722 [Gigaspora rosea]|uniref:Uncharacterized protein n=1 Tax=Gigaspora rosea TaxID=44941 RepID=A0A397VWM1_9GLOM|nr:hypothetical protein C2G38_2168722 [Gigaspora rosea]
MSANSRHHYAYLALEKKRKELSFYADLHQEKFDQKKFLYSVEAHATVRNNLVENCNDKDNIQPKFLTFVSSPSLIDITTCTKDINSDNEKGSSNDEMNFSGLIMTWRVFLKGMILYSIRNAERINNNGYQQSSKRIRVQVALTARRKEGSSNRQKKLWQGRPKKSAQDIIEYEPTRFVMPTCSKDSKKNVRIICVKQLMKII